MSFVCDCGQIYSERAAVRECQAANHSAAAGNELVDAEEACRRAGIPATYENDQRPGQVAASHRRPTAEVVLPEFYLQVGLTIDCREVVINHPKLVVDRNGQGYITFSPTQARSLARLLLRKADECTP